MLFCVDQYLSITRADIDNSPRGIDDAIKQESDQGAASHVETIGEVHNALMEMSHQELMDTVVKFQQEKGLPDDMLPILEKGALVAQNPAGFDELGELDESEKTALREEVSHRWKHPWALYYTVILNSISAAIQGWDQVSDSVTFRIFSTI